MSVRKSAHVLHSGVEGSGHESYDVSWYPLWRGLSGYTDLELTRWKSMRHATKLRRLCSSSHSDVRFVSVEKVELMEVGVVVTRRLWS